MNKTPDAVKLWVETVARTKLRQLTDDQAMDWLYLLKVGHVRGDPPAEAIRILASAILTDLTGVDVKE